MGESSRAGELRTQPLAMRRAEGTDRWTGGQTGRGNRQVDRRAEGTVRWTDGQRGQTGGRVMLLIDINVQKKRQHFYGHMYVYVW